MCVCGQAGRDASLFAKTSDCQSAADMPNEPNPLAIGVLLYDSSIRSALSGPVSVPGRLPVGSNSVDTSYPPSRLAHTTLAMFVAQREQEPRGGKPAIASPAFSRDDTCRTLVVACRMMGITLRGPITCSVRADRLSASSHNVGERAAQNGLEIGNLFRRQPP